MTAQRLTDAQITTALRAHLPAHARADVRQRIAAEVTRTPQARPLPRAVARFVEADRFGNRRALLLVAAALLALGVVVAATVGALLNRNSGPVPITLDAPSDVPALVRSAYTSMAGLPPVTITAVEDDGRRIRILVSASGAVRIERYVGPGATEPASYEVLVGTTKAHVLEFEGERVWYRLEDAIEVDARVSVYATLGSAAFGSTQPACQTVASSDGSDVGLVGTGYRWLGAEALLGRATHHVGCSGELWIDDETRLVLRSRGPRLDENYQPIEGQVRTLEVTALEFGPPPADLFDLGQPAGTARISDDDYACASNPYCLAPERPLVTPPPAPNPGTIPDDIEALVADTQTAAEGFDAFELTLESSNTKYPGTRSRLLHDGSGHYRWETFAGGDAEPSIVTLVLDDGVYMSRIIGPDQSTWERSPGDGVPRWPLQIFDSCEAGWTHAGVDLVAGRIADQIACAGSDNRWWIDRELGVVIRNQMSFDEQSGTNVEEITTLQLGAALDPALFALPAGADVFSPAPPELPSP
jgi:hypothetical protein